MICIIIPIIAGYVWPSGVNEGVSYSTESETDITNTYRTTDVTNYGFYTGVANNAYWPISNGANLSYSGILYPNEKPTSSVPSSERAWAYTSDTQTAYVAGASFETIVTNAGYDYDDTDVAYYTLYFTAGVALDMIQTFDDNSTNIVPLHYAMYSPSTGLMTFITEDDGIINLDTTKPLPWTPTFQINPDLGGTSNYGVYKYSFVSGQYYIGGSPHDLDYMGQSKNLSMVWSNGYVNRGVDFIIDDSSLANGKTLTFEIPNGPTITIEHNNEWLEYDIDGVPYNHVIKYSVTPYLWVRYMSYGEVRIEPLTNLNSWDDANYINKGLLVNAIRADVTGVEFNSVNIYGDYVAGWHKVYCAGAFAPIGTIKAIQDEWITGYNYSYPYWSLSLGSPSTVGDFISFGTPGDHTDYMINGGEFTVNGETFNVRNLMILAVKNDDSVTWDIYLNDKLVFDNVIQDWGVYLGGTWITVLKVYKVTPEVYEYYDLEPGAFSFGVSEFCLVGLASAVLAFIACALYSKKSGINMMALLITLGAVGSIYIIILMEPFA